jgi:hypothetical protein
MILELKMILVAMCDTPIQLRSRLDPEYCRGLGESTASSAKRNAR